MDVPLRERLDRVAGVSRRAPLFEYRVEGLSFGEAVLRRHPGHGRWESLHLALTPDATEASGISWTTVAWPMDQWLTGVPARAKHDGDVTARIHGLLVTHALLSNPGWLLDEPSGFAPSDGSAASVLEELRAVLSRVTDTSAKCPACAPPYEGRAGRSSWFTRVRAGARSSPELLRRLGFPEGDDGTEAPPSECPHAAMRREALRALVRASPELAFEAAGVLVAAPMVDSPRFVLSPTVMKAAVGDWLKFHGGEDPLGPSAGDPRARAGSPRATGTDAAMAFAAEAWGTTERVVLLPTGAVAEVPVMGTEVALPAVALLWPEGISTLQEDAPAPKPKRAKAARPPRPKG